MVILARKFMRQRHLLDNQAITDIFPIDVNLNCCCSLGTKLNHCLCSDLNQKDITQRDQEKLQTQRSIRQSTGIILDEEEEKKSHSDDDHDDSSSDHSHNECRHDRI